MLWRRIRVHGCDSVSFSSPGKCRAYLVVEYLAVDSQDPWDLSWIEATLLHWNSNWNRVGEAHSESLAASQAAGTADSVA